MIVDLKIVNAEGTEEWLQTDYFFLDEEKQIARFRASTLDGVRLVEVRYRTLERKYSEDGFWVFSDVDHGIFVPQEFRIEIVTRKMLRIPEDGGGVGEDRN